ncbi:hypothetical protein PQ610_07000 [Tardisphaera miroshnichenkoae]
MTEFLGSGISQPLRERLSYELERLSRVAKDYPYSREEAIARLNQDVQDFGEEDLDSWEKKGLVGETAIEGQRRYFWGFADNLFSTKSWR